MTGSAAPAPSPLRHLLVFLLLLFVGLMAWLPSFRVPFIYDDLAEIVGNPALAELGQLKRVLSYNPARALLMLTFALDLKLWGTHTFPYHVENFVIHLANGLLLYALLERLLPSASRPLLSLPRGLRVPASWSAALAGSLLFMVHPLFVEAVTYIASRSSSLATLFYLLAFLGYVTFRRGTSATTSGAGAASPLVPPWLALLLSANAYLLAIFTKEEGVSLPAILLMYDLLLAPGRPTWRASDRLGARLAAQLRFLLPVLPYWLLFGLLVLARIKLYDTLMPEVMVRSVGVNLLSNLEAVWKYVRLLLLPQGLSLYHDYQEVSSPWRWQTLLASLGHLALLATALRFGRRQPLLAFGIAWFYIALSPTSSIMPLKEIIAEHRMYLGSIGFFMIFAFGLETLHTRFRLPPPAVALVLAVPLAGLTFQYNQLWQDPVKLWEHAVRLAPHSGDAAYALGDVYRRQNALGKAEESYRNALRNYEDRQVPQKQTLYSYVDTLNNLGLVYAQQGNLDLAISHFRRAIQAGLRAKVGYAQAWNNLGFAQLQKGNALEASLAFEEALAIAPDSWLAHYHLGNLYYGPLKDSQKAIEHYKRTLELNPALPARSQLETRIRELEF